MRLLDAAKAILEFLPETSLEAIAPKIFYAVYIPPLPEPEVLRNRAKRIEKRDAAIEELRAAIQEAEK